MTAPLTAERRAQIEALLDWAPDPLKATSPDDLARSALQAQDWRVDAKAAIRDLLAAMPDWQPIETAPKVDHALATAPGAAGMSEIELMARLLEGVRTITPWANAIARRLHEAGLTIVPIEPDEATLDRVARAMHDDWPSPRRQGPWDELDAAGKSYWLRKARAAHRAFVGEP